MSGHFNLTLSRESQPEPDGVVGRAYDAAVAEPFFDIDKCIDAARSAARGLHRTAWEYRSRDNLKDYRRCVQNAWDYRRRARIWEAERDG